MNKAREVAGILTLLRRVCHAAGGDMTLQSVEVLLLVAGGVDRAADLMAATGRTDRSDITRALQFLEGRSVARHRRVSPLVLVERRKHPHRAGHQFRLTEEGIALLRPTFTRVHTPDWT